MPVRNTYLISLLLVIAVSLPLPGQGKEKVIESIMLYMSKSDTESYRDMSEEEKQETLSNLMKVANAYCKEENYVNAFDLYMQALRLCESAEDRKMLPEIYIRIGGVFSTYREFESSIRYYRSAEAIYRARNDTRSLLPLYLRMAGTYIYLDDLPKAREYFARTEGKIPDGNPEMRYHYLYNKGLILRREKKYSDAVGTFRQTLSSARCDSLSPYHECKAYEQLYATFWSAGNADSTMRYLRLCRETAERNRLSSVTIETLRAYTEIYESLGKHEAAMRYKLRYLALSDSVFNDRDFNRIRNINTLYEQEKASTEINSLRIGSRERDKRIRSQRIFIAGVLTVTAIIAVLLVVVYRQKRKLAQARSNLFDVNMEVLDSERDNRLMRQELEEKPAAAREEKYQSSSLGDSQKSRLLESIKEIMENTEEFCSPDFSLDQLASLVGSNSKYVSQAINEIFGKNFSAFVNSYRVKLARIWLSDVEKYGNYTIKAISDSLGYRSTTTFTNAFRSITGITPSVFQKMAREKAQKEKKIDSQSLGQNRFINL